MFLLNCKVPKHHKVIFIRLTKLENCWQVKSNKWLIITQIDQSQITSPSAFVSMQLRPDAMLRWEQLPLPKSFTVEGNLLFFLPHIKTLMIPDEDELTSLIFSYRRKICLIRTAPKKKQLTHQLHPEFPQPQQEHCRAGRETGSCARKSRGGVS